MTVRLINLSSIKVNNAQPAPLALKRTKWGRSIIIDQSVVDLYNIMFTEDGEIFNIQETIEQYGQDSKQYSHISRQILKSKKRIFMAQVNRCDLTGDFNLCKATIVEICHKQTHKEFKHLKNQALSSITVPLDTIYCSLFMKLKQCFLSQSTNFAKVA